MTKYRKKPVDEKCLKCNWMITGVNGEHYPCKPDIFETTYEEVGDILTKIPLMGQLAESQEEVSRLTALLKLSEDAGRDFSLPEPNDEFISAFSDKLLTPQQAYTKENDTLADRVSKIEEELFHRQDDEPAKLSEDKGIDKAFKDAEKRTDDLETTNKYITSDLENACKRINELERFIQEVALGDRFSSGSDQARAEALVE